MPDENKDGKKDEKKDEKKDDHGGGHGHGGGGGGPGTAWMYAILFIVIVFSGVILAFTNQLGAFLQMLRTYGGPLLIIVGLIWLFRSTKKT